MQLAKKEIAKGELVFTGFLFATSVVVLVDTNNMIESNAVGFVGPKVFAFMVGILMFVLSSIQLFAVLRGAKGEPEGIEAGALSQKANWKSFIYVLAGLVLYATFVEILGFLIMGPILYFAVAKAIGAKNNLLTVIVAMVLSVIVFLGFTQGLQLYLPIGFDFILDPAGGDSGW